MTPIKDNSDTIAAIATPQGEGGIAVVRVSGPRAFAITDINFSGRALLASAKSHTMHYGHFLAGGAHMAGQGGERPVLDTVVAMVYRAPHSYTGEDTVEVSCHGGYFVSQQVLQALLAGGARLAEPGEFTLRAFLNGRLDLAQAEAVADLIRARSEKAHRTSIAQLEGSLSRYIGSLRGELMDLCALFELELDFSEEDIELADREEAKEALRRIRATIRSAITSFAGGRLVREGVTAVLAGKPNAGKSSLLNILLDENRAIVSHIPGTTRDMIQESASINGLLFTFIDTAGLRETADEIEQEGVRRTQARMADADLVVLLVDASHPADAEDVRLYREIARTRAEQAVLLTVFNKADIESPEFKDSVSAFTNEEGRHSVSISCRTHEGIARFKEMLYHLALPHYDTDARSITITNLRHKQSLEAAEESLRRAQASLDGRASGELIAIDLREAMEHLGMIIGVTTPEDILNTIFSKFCIGK
ncbi:MAG: tRNA uridine-5-carboxymethylaminomethyl(34) synthesis GTPase MnmE [Acidobacteriota bacterium]